MAVGPRTWTVAPHDPIEELAPNLWRVEGVMTKDNRRVMILARLADGRVLVHNAIALDDGSMAKIDAWGEVASIIVPNSFHRNDAFIMQQRYPKAKVYAPAGAVKAASKATPCAGAYSDVPTDASVTFRSIDGLGEREGVMLVRSGDGVSAVYCDTLLNLPAKSGLIGFALHPTGTLSVPRFMSWVFVKDKKALKADLLRLASEDGLARVIPGHGAVISAEPKDRLREAAERL